MKCMEGSVPKVFQPAHRRTIAIIPFVLRSVRASLRCHHEPPNSSLAAGPCQIQNTWNEAFALQPSHWVQLLFQNHFDAMWKVSIVASNVLTCKEGIVQGWPPFKHGGLQLPASGNDKVQMIAAGAAGLQLKEEAQTCTATSHVCVVNCGQCAG